ncbi:arf-GAP with Rho-GAP domain, ANK repeat and PH domain-containing protein 2 isoform X2 [Battus philenor]|uniref:arf-GAP with Rho-GAP domain, ANK repeat and PH domain-containing protein 2 isoform X2 n=1 Tax=Battus philenor TaxID=42288 RepID=UPI0035D0BA90
MDTPPVPKPRSAFMPQIEKVKKPVPLPRTKVPGSHDRASTLDILRSIGTVSKHITEDVALKVTNSAKSANEKFEKSLQDGSKLVNKTLEKTLTTSRAVRNTLTKTVIETSKLTGLKQKQSKKDDNDDSETPRCVSMPALDVSLFDNIQFHSPLLKQKIYDDDHPLENNNFVSLHLNSSQLDDLSLFSNNSDCATDSVSNFSYDSNQDLGTSNPSINFESETYDTPRPSRQNSLVSVRSAPDKIGRQKKSENTMEFMRHNSLYENWLLPSQKNMSENVNMERPSKSTILEFDPLNTAKAMPKYDGVSNELLLLESFLIGDTYGTIVSTESNEETYDMMENDYFNPPTPPERSDSLFPEDSPGTSASTSLQKEPEKDKNSNWFIGSTTENKQTEEAKSNSVMQKFSHMLKLDSRKTSKQPVQKVAVVERPEMANSQAPYYSGILIKTVPRVVEDLFKNSQSLYCTLADQKLLCYADSTKSILKGAYTLNHVNSLQIVLPLSSSASNGSYSFELSIMTCGARNSLRKILFSCSSAAERRNWAQKIAEHLTIAFPNKYLADFTRCGWCYLKEGVSGEWRGAWLMLIRRNLMYSCTGSGTCCIDLRKTRFTQEADDETKLSCPSDDSPNLLLDCPVTTVYLRFPHEKELEGWKYMIKLAAHNNGAHLHHQQLTKEDVPTIVDKCISFIYAHGSLSEGIYRRAGSSVVLTELLARFRRDAWSVQLTPGQHSEHDVAGVLKRFFRDLPVALIPQECHQVLIAALEINDEAARHQQYRSTLNSLNIVARKTARKLFAHLHFLQSMAHANKMNAENLASVWSPTIMPSALASNSLQTAWSSKEVLVVRDLIASYEAVWQPTEAERRREAAVYRVLARVLASATPAAPAAPRSAGDLRAWLYVHNRTTCYQVTLTPNKTSADVCIELCEKANMESHLLMLEEVICNDSMRRIVHLDEVVLDVVLRWGYWDEEDRKDNYLVVRENSMLQQLDALKHSTAPVCGELRLANESSKSFKLYMFEFNKSKLCYFKDKQGSHKIEEWNIKDIIWYIGHEPKRNPQCRWAITFIPRNNKQKRSKDRPWFGCTIAGAVTEDQLKWTAAMTFAEYSNILPTPRLVIT